MLVRKQEQPSFFRAINEYKTVLYWCSDGWVYDIVKKTRRRYHTDGDLFNIEEEPTTIMSFSDVEQSETIVITVYRESPRIWKEEGDGWSDSFCVVVE